MHASASPLRGIAVKPSNEGLVVMYSDSAVREANSGQVGTQISWACFVTQVGAVLRWQEFLSQNQDVVHGEPVS